MSRTLAEWLSFQERVNPHRIELGLERVREVWRRLGAPAPAPRVITVGGTNGKGSTVGFVEATLRAAGWHVGAYTSPHLVRYTERIRIDGHEIDEAALIAAFERVEAARGELALTYFEYGTLAALDLFSRAGLDVVVLEVGLGGRLDAVNLIDADVAIVVTVDLDHMDWLGPDRDAIGREKAGIARAGRPVILGESDPPQGLLDALVERGARIQRVERDFHLEHAGECWHWWHADGTRMTLPAPALAAPVQFANAAAAIAAVHALGARGLAPAALATAAAQGIVQARAAARLQALGGDPALYVDVGHNPQAARALAAWLDAQPRCVTHAVYGALADKDVAGVIAALGPRIDHWHLAGLDQASPRGLAAPALAGILAATLPTARSDAHVDVATALAAARAAACPGERLLAFGSFFVAGQVLGQTPR